MPPSSQQIEVDTGWVFWRSFLLVFLVREAMVWHWIQRLPRRLPPGHQLMIFLVWPNATRASLLLALLLGGVITLVAVLAVSLIVRPLLNRWRRPLVDPAESLFHLAASESPVASTPARRKSGWRWQPGALILTNRRLWFFPASWHDEPWSLAREDLTGIDLEPVSLAQLAPIRNWPDRLRLSTLTGEGAAFAVADPHAVRAWFGSFQGRNEESRSGRVAAQGVLDD
jgi:hypothetical protein